MPLSAAARNERAAWLRLVLTPGVGPATARDLLAAIGPPEDILGSRQSALARVAGTPPAAALLGESAARDAAVARALDWAEAPHHHLLTLADPDYPARLLHIGDPPPLLYVLGDRAALARASIAIVGSRSGSRAGEQNAEAFARALGDAGLTVVSGLARGIDAAAHRGALGSAAGTVAILGTGADVAYPRANASLADAIAGSGGAIVSEQPLGTGPARGNFPRRNRLIAGVSLGVLVVEAAPRSGSLITARLAGEFGREVFAIPGSIHSPLSRGCHQLIRQGAQLVETPDDVLAELPGFAPASRARPPGDAEPADTPVLRALGWDPLGPEGLARAMERLAPGQASPGEIASRLLELELRGLVERLPDGRLQRRPSPSR